MSSISQTLKKNTGVFFVSYTVVAAFMCYFAMYAFRKPFSAATYEGLHWFGTNIGLKEAIVACQVIGYAISKVFGIKFCAELKGHQREFLLVGLIVMAELALLLFGILPNDYKFIGIVLNGLSLGMIWGLVVSYLEGRSISEILLAGLSCSFIVSSGIVKDFGRAILAGDGASWWHGIPFLSKYLVHWYGPVSEGWMPFIVGLHFIPIFLLSVWMLKQLPSPNKIDVKERSERLAMDKKSRFKFVKEFSAGLFVLCVAYLLLTVYRDFRDNFQVGIFEGMGYDGVKNESLMSQSEGLVSLVIIIGLASLYWLRRRFKKFGLALIWGYMLTGILLMAGSLFLYRSHVISGFSFMVISGIGSYMGYVPFGSVLFDQVIASTRFKGNAVFGIYIADSIGYIGVVGFLLSKNAIFGNVSKLNTYIGLTWVLIAVGFSSLIWSFFYFRAKEKEALGIQENPEDDESLLTPESSI